VNRQDVPKNRQEERDITVISAINHSRGVVIFHAINAQFMMERSCINAISVRSPSRRNVGLFNIDGLTQVKSLLNVKSVGRPLQTEVLSAIIGIFTRSKNRLSVTYAIAHFGEVQPCRNINFSIHKCHTKNGISAINA
jgi:hypothetical protein